MRSTEGNGAVEKIICFFGGSVLNTVGRAGMRVRASVSMSARRILDSTAEILL